MYLYLNTVLTKVFAIVFVFGKFIVFVFVFKYYAMYLDPSLVATLPIYVPFVFALVPHVCDNCCDFYRAGRDNHTVFLTTVFCKGYENQLIDCRHDFGDNLCTHNQDVILYCGMFISISLHII